MVKTGDRIRLKSKFTQKFLDAWPCLAAVTVVPVHHWGRKPSLACQGCARQRAFEMSPPRFFRGAIAEFRAFGTETRRELQDYDMTFTVEAIGCRDDYALSRVMSAMRVHEALSVRPA